jgi:hypothetical protein
MASSRRHTLRLRCDLPAHWRGARGSGDSRVLDISERGLLLGGVGDLAPGDHVDVVVDVSGEAIALGAAVRFVGNTRYGFGCGVAVDAAGDGSTRWAAYYRRLAERTIGRAPPSIQRYLRRRTAGGASV